MEGIPSVNTKPVEVHKLPAKEPDLIGPWGKAWKADLDGLRKRLVGDDRNVDDASIISWVVYAPWAHPMWHSYWIFLVHLRPLPGGKPPVIHMPGATHEMMLYAADPRFRPALDNIAKFLVPGNFVGQFKVASDEEAAARVQKDVKDIIEGKLNPDTDALQMWIARYGNYGLKPEYRVHPTQPVGHA